MDTKKPKQSGSLNLPPEQQKLLNRSLATKAGIQVAQRRQWVESTVYYTDRLAKLGKGAGAAEIGFFWIRLYGLFADIRRNFEEALKAINDTYAGRPLPPSAQPVQDILKRPLFVLDKAMKLLSEDELLFLKYRRDTEAHPWQDGYDLDLTGKKGHKQLRKTCPVFGRNWQIEELQDRIRQVHRKYRMDDDAAAVDFARRVQPVMHELLAEFMLGW